MKINLEIIEIWKFAKQKLISTRIHSLTQFKYKKPRYALNGILGNGAF